MEGLGGSLAKTGVSVILDSDPAGIIKGFADADTAGKKFAATLGAISNVGKASFNGLQRVAAGFATTARHVRNAGIGLGLSLAAATYGAMQLQGAMHNVATIDEDVRENFKRSIQTAIDMSRVLPESASNITAAWYEIASSGFTGAAGTTVLTQAIKAGSAGMSNTAEAGAGLTAVLNAYGLSANNAQRISDLMFQTVNLGVVKFGELTGIVGDSVGTAAAAGVSFKEVGAAISTMTVNGISAAEAGTSLNRLIQNLIQPSESLSLAWSQLSNESLTMALRHQGLKAVMDQLRVASGGNIEVLMSWFDEIRAARGALALMNNEGATYARIFRGMDEATKGVGATQRAFNEQMQSTSMQLKLLLNQFKSIGLEIGNALLPLTGAMIRTARIFLDSWNAIPGPIKEIIAHFAALASVVMTVGGVLAVLAAKTIITTTATRLLGRGLELAGAQVTRWGAGWQRAGDAMTGAAARVRGASGTFNLLAPLTGTVNVLGFAFQNLGNRISTSTVPAFTAAGNVITRFGAGMRSLANMIPALAVSLPALATGMFLLASSFSQANQNADMWIQNITRRFNQDTVEGLNKGIDVLGRRADEASAAWNRWGVNTRLLGTDLDALKGNLGLVKASAAQTVGAVTNLFGFGTPFGNPAEDRAKANAAINAYNDFVEKRNNLFRASSMVMNEVAKTDENFWDQILGGDRRQNMVAQTGFINLVSKAAKNLGIDLKNTKDLSVKHTRELSEEVQRMAAKTGQSAGQLSQAGDAAVENWKKQKKAVDDFVKSADEAFTKGFDIVGAVTEKGAAGQEQLKKFFYTTVGASTQFVNDIEQLMRRGLDPEILMQLVSAGPEAANLAIKALLDDSSGQMIEFANQAIGTMRELRIQLAREAAFISKAALNPMIASQVGQALDIANIAQFMGVRNTPEKIAFIMGLDPATVTQIARDFEIPLGAGLSETAATALDKFSAKFGPKLGEALNKAADEAQISDFNAGRVFETLVTKGHEAAVRVVESMNLIDPKKQILLDLIGELETTMGLNNVGTKADEVGAKKPTVNVHAQDWASNIINGVDAAVRRVPVWWNTTFTASDAVSGVANSVIDSVNRAKTAVGSFINAKGNIYPPGMLAFAGGGEIHNAMITRIPRVWGEPETGGEAYIPLNNGRPTPRSLAIMRHVADMFGYEMMRRTEAQRFANGALIGGSNSSVRSGPSVVIRSNIEFSGNIAGHEEFRKIVTDVVDRRDRAIGIAISRRG